MKYYLAYGSNLNMMQMAYRCPSAVRIGTAEIKGYRLLYKGSLSGAYLTIKKDKGHTVPVGVWGVEPSDEMSLDRYEGFPNFYYRKEMLVDVRRDDGVVERLCCFVYIMREDSIPSLPSMHYVDVCTEGYADFGFDIGILDEAYGYTARMAGGRNGIRRRGIK